MWITQWPVRKVTDLSQYWLNIAWKTQDILNMLNKAWEKSAEEDEGYESGAGLHMLTRSPQKATSYAHVFMLRHYLQQVWDVFRFVAWTFAVLVISGRYPLPQRFWGAQTYWYSGRYFSRLAVLEECVVEGLLHAEMSCLVDVVVLLLSDCVRSCEVEALTEDAAAQEQKMSLLKVETQKSHIKIAAWICLILR